MGICSSHMFDCEKFARDSRWEKRGEEADTESAGDDEIESFEVKKEKLIKTVSETIERINPDKNIFNEGGKFRKEIGTGMLEILNASILPDTVTSAERVKHAKVIADLLVEDKMVTFMCSVITTIYRKYSVPKEECDVFEITTICLQFFSEVSGKFCSEVSSNQKFVKTMRSILRTNFDFWDYTKEQFWVTDLVVMVLRILHHITISNESCKNLSSIIDGGDLVPYLRLPDPGGRLLTIACIIQLPGETETIYENNKSIDFLLAKFDEGLEREQLESKDGWSCRMLATMIKHLAADQRTNKPFKETNCLEMLVKLGNLGQSEDEKLESVRAIKSLAFHVVNRQKMVSGELGVIELLVKLKKSESSSIQTACEEALFELREELRDSKTYNEFGDTKETKDMEVQKPIGVVQATRVMEIEESEGGVQATKVMEVQKIEGCVQATKVMDIEEPSTGTSPPDGKQDDGHIMISYQTASRETMKSIRNELVAAKNKVWMDIDDMGGGSTLEAMASAVEKARIVLICISDKYQNSDNCKREAEYAATNKKPMLFLKLERDFIPKGWLGIICGASYFYEFTDKYPFDEKMAELLKAVDKI